jgi:hypothetical protein
MVMSTTLSLSNGLTRGSHTKNRVYGLDGIEFEAICIRTYFCEKIGGTVRFKRGDRVRYFIFESFVIIDGNLDVFKKHFYKHFKDVSDWREDRINEILD